ncbi:Histidine kinase-, DNA gyrase B-, and HSP90-like ATPase family protein, partial [Prunus dulcis]
MDPYKRSLECQFEVLYALPRYLLGSRLHYKYHAVKVSRGVGYPALRQAPYVALVVPAYGEILGDSANFGQKVS